MKSRKSEHDRTTTGTQTLPGKVRGTRTGQEYNGCRYLCRCTDTAHRVIGFNSLLGVSQLGKFNIGVSVGPGATAFTNIRGDNSRAHDRVNPITAALLAT